MPDGSQIIIQDVNVNPNTGHITVRVRTRTIQGNAQWDGPERLYGTDAAHFQHTFQGDIEQFKTWIAVKHQAYVGAHADFVQKLGALKGQVIG